MKFQYKTNNGNFNFNLEYDKKSKHYTLTALDGNNIMSVAIFCVKNKTFDKKIWIENMETKKDYSNRGIATAFLNTIEYFAYTQGMKYVEGKYYPKNDYARPLYEYNGYKILNKDLSWYISKELDFEKVKKIKDNLLFEKTEEAELIF